jgi:nucleoside-diphosphate-sugar epimerase
MSEAPLVLVTGVSGFVAGWVAYGALKMGYRVRGTVRSLADPKVDADLCPGSRHKIELVEANLTDEECWTAAVEGCEYILHVASPNPLVFPKDPNDVIRPAVEGTPNVLKAASKMATPPKRVVVTSSCAAVFAGTDPTNKVYTDADWTVPDSKQFPISTYYRSKLEAERAAWAFVEGLPDDHKFELATVNPCLVQGPLINGAKSCASADIIKQVGTHTDIALRDSSLFLFPVDS